MVVGAWRREFAERWGVVPLERRPGSTRIGYRESVSGELRQWLMTLYGAGTTLERVEPALFDNALGLLGLDDPASADHPGIMELEELDRRVDHLPASEQALRAMLQRAVAESATDLSLWMPDPWHWAVSARTGAGLERLPRLSREEGDSLVRLLMVRAGLDPLEGAGEQDGTISVPWLPGIAVRVSCVDTDRTRAVSLRFLHRRPPVIDALGFETKDSTVLRAACRARSGLTLFCGATGSGKTTTMSAVLTEVCNAGRRVVTIEDPVEYELPEALQIEERSCIDPVAAALRQDPDVLAIGEVRRRRHGHALRDALFSGHQVFATVHAASLEMMFARLAQLGLSAAGARSALTLAWYQERRPDGRFTAGVWSARC